MNEWNRQQVEDEPLLESCDVCNKLIFNWETLTNSYISFDNKIVCGHCLINCKKDKSKIMKKNKPSSGLSEKQVQLKEWEPHEIDISPEQYQKELENAYQALASHDEARRKLEKRINDLKYGSFFHRSMMRAKYPEFYVSLYRINSDE